VTTLEALAAEAAQQLPGRAVLAALDGGRGEIHAALYDAQLQPLSGPAVMSAEAAARLGGQVNAVLAGAAAAQLSDAADQVFDSAVPERTADIAVYARLAANKGAGEKPRPLYLRDADARPQAGFVLPRSDS
jgi:tRNA A37 threonylcarbamoyladenosine modification protein TsaB